LGVGCLCQAFLVCVDLLLLMWFIMLSVVVLVVVCWIGGWVVGLFVSCELSCCCSPGSCGVWFSVTWSCGVAAAGVGVWGAGWVGVVAVSGLGLC